MGEIYRFCLLSAAREIAKIKNISDKELNIILTKHGIIPELMTQDEMDMFNKVIKDYMRKNIID